MRQIITPRRVLGGLFAGLIGMGLSVKPVGGQTPLPVATTPTSSPAPTAAPTPTTDASRPVAYIYGSIPVTQDEFGRFLMDRGGLDKLELFINKKIIEEEARKANVTVSKLEMEAALMEDLEGIQVKKAEFIKIVLPKYNKSLYEWMEDVIRPRLLLTKMCRQRIKVSEEDLKKQFERRFGEQRKVQMVMWPKGDDLKGIQAQYAKLRESQAEFDSAARAQANPSLAASLGFIKPITKHLTAEDKSVEETAFALKVGEVSHILSTHQGYIVMKLHEVIPPNKDAKFEEARPMLEKMAFEELITAEIPKFFAELRNKAKPQLLFTGPADWKTISAPDAPVLPTGGVVIQPPAPTRK